MPQLDPAPWLLVLSFSWLIFLLFMPYKILAYSFPNTPSHLNAEKHTPASWSWDWY